MLNRKQFFGRAGALFPVAVLPGALPPGRPAGWQPQEARSNDPEESERFLREVAAFCEEELFNRFLPAMERDVIDHEYGGFLCELDIRTGERRSEEKRSWYEGRGIWLYSTLYSEIDPNPEWLSIARRSRDLVIGSRPQSGRFWPSRYRRDGGVLREDGDIFSDLYLAEGFSAYAKASGEQEALHLAIDMTYEAFQRYDSPDYRYSSATAAGLEGPRVLNHWMVLLFTAVQILDQRRSGRMEEVAVRSVEAILNLHMNPEYGLLNDVLLHDGTLPAERERQVASTGLGIQALWMVMAEAVRRRDGRMFRQAADHFRRHVTVSRDPVYGGHFRSLESVDDHRWSLDKALGVQEEVMIGALLLFEQAGDPWARSCYEELHDYTLGQFRREGHRFWIPGGDRKLERVQTGRAEHYHHPRRLLFNLLSARRSLSRDLSLRKDWLGT